MDDFYQFLWKEHLLLTQISIFDPNWVQRKYPFNELLIKIALMRTLQSVFFAVFIGIPLFVAAQEDFSLSGNLETNVNFYLRDPEIGAINTPQYEHQQIGFETWLDIRAQYSGFEFGMRYDIFNNSALLNPQDSYTAQGIGRWYAGKKIGKLSILGGYIYDQFGAGTIFRAYEQRPLLIDNALVGVKLTYELSDDWTLKGIGGQQKNLFDVYSSVLTGFNIDGYLAIGEKGLSLAPGLGIMHKTLSDDQMESLAGTLSSYTPEDFIPEAPYNTIAVSLYNTLSLGRFSWYVEGAYKSEEVLYDNYATRTLWTGVESEGKFVLTDGYVLYTTLSYAGGGLGISGQYKRTKNFVFDADPFAAQNRGMISFLPPMTRVNTYRLTARYSPATQFLDEQAYLLDVRYALNKRLSFLVNVSHITRPDATVNMNIYDELYTQVTWKKPKEWTLIGGVQFQNYNQELYEGKPGVPPVKTITPYLDFLYKFDRKKSLRVEFQYMNTKEDYGSWLYGLLEYSISPHWVFELSDMYNVAPNNKGGVEEKKIHYPTAGVVYSAGRTRYALRYVKQVEGIVCSGGICRLEPAFSGFRFNVSSSF